MLGLKRHNIAGLGDYQLLAIYLAYFRKRKYDEGDRNKNMIKLK